MMKEAVDNPLVAELEAVRAALLEALQNSWRIVEVQLEIKAITNSLQQKISPVLEATTIADDIFLLASIFESCLFSYVHKSFDRFCSKLRLLTLHGNLMQRWKIMFSLWMQHGAAENLRPR